VEQLPLELTHHLLDTGRHHFEQICATCHGVLGDGDTVVAERMRRRPPSLHEARLVELSPGRLFQIASEGYGYMPGYESVLSVDDRWAVVAYVQALQKSQRLRLAELPPDVAERIRRRLR
jgi:mono/diheme cytochrome c family protein